MHRIALLVAVLHLACLAAAEPYRLKPGDFIKIRLVLGVEGLVPVGPSEMELEIPPGGEITVPYAGAIQASGRTAVALQDHIASTLRPRFPYSQCFVLLTKVRPTYFSIIGEVSEGGQFALPDKLTLREAIALAGGLSLRPERLQAAIFRDGKLRETFDLYNVGATDDSAGSLLIEPGDVISIQTLRQLRVWSSGLTRQPGTSMVETGTSITEFVSAIALPGQEDLREQIIVTLSRQGVEVLRSSLLQIETGRAPNFELKDGDFVSLALPETHRVWVFGSVENPGQKDVPVGSPITRAIANSGGLSTDASLRDVRVIRGDQTITVDLRSNVEGIPIEAGDLIVVSTNTRRVAVMGEVNTPGLFTMRDDDEMHLSDAIGMAGGLTKRGPANRLSIIRVLPDGDVSTISVDFSKYLKDGDPSANPVLVTGDIIFAGETPRIEFEKIVSAVLSAAGIANILRR